MQQYLYPDYTYQYLPQAPVYTPPPRYWSVDEVVKAWNHDLISVGEARKLLGLDS